jgi:hypothetical protein
MKNLLFFIFLIGVSLCWWEDPVRLASPDGQYIRASYIDIDNKIYFLKFKDYNNVVFAAFNRTGESYDLWRSWTSNWQTQCAKTELIGKEDGLHLMIICGNNTDILYSETENTGKNWTQLTILQPHDTNKRMLGSAFWIPSTGRVFIFYHSFKSGAATQIVYKSRPKDSAVFGPETLVYRSFDYTDFVPSLKATYHDHNGKIFIHLVWHRFNEDVKECVYTNSENNGNTWRDPKPYLTPKFNEDLTTIIPTTFRGKYTFVFNRNNTNSRYIGQYTSNDGLTFSAPEDYGPSVYSYVWYTNPWSMTYCVKAEHLFVSMVHGQAGFQAKPVYSIMNTQTGKKFNIPSISHYSLGQALHCYYNETTGYLNVDLFYVDSQALFYKMSDRTPLALIHGETS